MRRSFLKQSLIHWALISFALLLILVPAFLLVRRKCRCVPDVVHFYRGAEEAGNVTGAESLCLRAALALQGAVHVHSARPRATLAALRALGPWPPSLRVLPAPDPPPPHAFTGPAASHRAARLLSLHILRTYGGIFLGNDVYLLQSLDEFRGDEMTVSLRRGQVQTQLLIAQRDARFLQAWLASYLHYRPEEEVLTSLPLDTARTLKEAVVPVFKDVFFLPDYIDTKDILAVQLLL